MATTGRRRRHSRSSKRGRGCHVGSIDRQSTQINARRKSLPAIVESVLCFALQLYRQEELANGIEGRDVVGGLPLGILSTRIGTAFIDENFDDLESRRSLNRHACMMQGSTARVIGLLNARARLVHEQADQADHAVLACHVNRKPSSALVDNGPNRIDLRNASHSGIFVQSRNGVVESTRRIGRRRCHLFAQLVECVRSPLKHDDCDVL